MAAEKSSGSGAKQWVANYTAASNFVLSAASWKYTHLKPTVVVPDANHIVITTGDCTWLTLSGSHLPIWRVYRDTTLISDGAAANLTAAVAYTNGFFIFADSPGAGTYTYQFGGRNSTGASANLVLWNSYLHLKIELVNIVNNSFTAAAPTYV